MPVQPGEVLLDRYLGALLGLACGDAVGTTVEFKTRGTFDPVTDMAGGGPFGLRPGEWTDDTSMALCLAHSLAKCQGFDPRDQMNRYSNWYSFGYMSVNGTCFDIGNTVRGALDLYQRTGEPFAGSTASSTAGNGSLMRLAPVALFYHPDESSLVHYCGESSRTTHGAPEAIECCRLLGVLISRALAGCPKAHLMQVLDLEFLEPKVHAISRGSFASKARELVVGSGYCVASLEAALWCFHETSDFEGAVLAAANLGDDADTTAAICGQLAGAHYGAAAIPSRWLDRLAFKDEIAALAEQIYRLRPAF